MSETLTNLLLLANLSSSLVMTGLIWFVQIVHYPLFASVGADGFSRYEAKHAQLTSFVVGPPMLIEAATSIALVFAGRDDTGRHELPLWAVVAGLVLVGVIWLSTAIILIPCHARLEAGFHGKTHRRLVNGNWIRTVAWTLRSCLALFLVSRGPR